jgi:hypothetical protein
MNRAERRRLARSKGGQNAVALQTGNELERILGVLPRDKEANWWSELFNSDFLEFSRVTDAAMQAFGDSNADIAARGGIVTPENARRLSAALLAYADKVDEIKATLERLRANSEPPAPG